jgi:DNA-binding CsgD family transcriptional regulator
MPLIPLEVPFLPTDVVSLLLASVARIADDHAEIVGRRKTMLLALAEPVGADGGFWSWGRGRADSGPVVPLARIDFGLDDHQRAAIMDWALDAEADRDFRGRIHRQMGNATRVTTVRHDIFSAEEWAAEPFIRRMLRRGGWSSWLHSVRYSDRDTWSSLFLLRKNDRIEFGHHEAAIAHLVLDAIPWLHSTAEQTLPPKALIGLTPRQRTIMLMVLDGMPRKAIASRLDIAKDTVGDHLKAIYDRLGVGSSSQLAALFLRNR